MIQILQLEMSQLDSKRANFLENYLKAFEGTAVSVQPVLVSKIEMATIILEGELAEKSATDKNVHRK